MRQTRSSGGALALILAAMVLPRALSGQLPAPVAPPPAATEAELQLQFLQADWLLDIARGMWRLPRPGEDAATPMFEFERRIVMLEAAIHAYEGHARANLELSVAAREAAAAYQQLAQEALESANRLLAEGRAEPGNRLRERSDRYARRSGELQNVMIESMARYVRQQQADVAAWRMLLHWQLELIQLTSERIDFLRHQLAPYEQTATAPDGPPPPGQNERHSILLALLADYHARQGDAARADELYRKALEVMPLHIDVKARLLESARARGDVRPADYLDFHLTGFRLNPAEPSTASNIAALLSRYGIHEHHVDAVVSGARVRVDRGAIGWIGLAIDIYRGMNREQPVPGWLLLQQAETQFLAGTGLDDRGRLEDAARTARQAIAQSEQGSLLVGANDAGAPLPAIDIEARLLLVSIMRSLDPQQAAVEIKTISDYYSAHRSKPVFQANANLLGWMSWFHLRVLDEPKMAVDLGRFAVRANPDSITAIRSLAAALASGDESAAREAVKLLTPLASAGDSWAFYYLARAHRTLKEDARANDLLVGLARERAGTLPGILARAELGEKAPPKQPVDDMRAMLSALPQGLFEFFRTPGRFAGIEVGLARGGQPFESVVLEVRLTNNSAVDGQEGFAITVGDGLMVWPGVLVSAAVRLPGEQNPRVFRNYCRLHIASPQILQPGQTGVALGSIDVGPVMQLLRMTPQAEKAINIQLLINPVATAPGQWGAGTGGYMIERAFSRPGVTGSREVIAGIVATSRTGQVGHRMLAHRAIGSLLVEQQLARQLSYRPRDVSPFTLAEPLEHAATDADPRIRAFLADAIYPVGLSGRLLDLADNGLGDRAWLVRLMTVRLLAERMGRRYEQQITRLAGQDENPLVRRLAQTYVDQWSAEAGRNP